MGKGKTQASISPRKSGEDVLLSRSLPRVMLARVVAGECATSDFVQVPPLPTFVLR